MSALKICHISSEVKETIKKFRLKKTPVTSAVILKISKETHELEVDEELEDCSLEEVVESLPEHQPRFVLLSYRLSHADGRLSYPLSLIFSSPLGSSPEVKMLYAGSKNSVVNESGVGKDMEIRELDELTTEFLHSKLL